MSTITDDLEVLKAKADLITAQAGASKAMADAASAVASARLDQLKAMIPDLSAVKGGTLDVKDGTPMWGSHLAFSSLEEIAGVIAQCVKEIISPTMEKPGLAVEKSGTSPRILVTSEPDLASLDAVYQEVASHIKQLGQIADTVTSVTAPQPADRAAPAPAPQVGEGIHELIDSTKEPDLIDIQGLLAGGAIAAVNPLAGVAMAAASVLPGLLSLLSVDRTLSTGATAVGDLAAAAAVAGSLAQSVRVVHDSLRLGKSEVAENFDNLLDKRGLLIRRKVTFSDQKTAAEARLSKTKEAASPDADTIADLTRKVADAKTRLALVEDVMAKIDAFATVARTVPQGGKRSLLSTASLYEALHKDGENGKSKLTHVLLVKAQAGQAQQELEHHKAGHDKFSTVADISITYMLLDLEGSTILGAGTVGGVASVYGKIGEEPTFRPAIHLTDGGPNGSSRRVPKHRWNRLMGGRYLTDK